MENKEYLNEESYQKAKKKITKISLIILIVGIVLGGSLIAVGAIKQSNAKKENEKRYNEAYKKSEDSYNKAKKEYDEKVTKTKERLEEIETEKAELKKAIDAKEYECNSLSMSMDNWFAENTKCMREVSDLQSKETDLESEEFQLNSSLKQNEFELEYDDYTVYYNMVSPIKYSIFYILGAGIIGISCMISLAFYIFAKKREIAAFTIQQTMPVAQEAIDKMAPTIGNAAGNIAGGIAKGIKEGLKDIDE